ncbi:hypothetical protein, partial [Escherichia coli]|uniref:hypothetical protein n=1 Tax=Escherichia coli TaxID=562 RepID=UPI00257288AD
LKASLSDGDNTFIVTAGNHAVGVLACASPGSARACVSSLDEESTADTLVSTDRAFPVTGTADTPLSTQRNYL